MKIKKTEGRCPVCGEQALEGLVNCSKCLVPHHNACWEYNGKCGIYACGASTSVTTEQDLGEWCFWCGSTSRVECASCETPNCFECFSKLKIACRGCGWLPGITPKPSGSMVVISSGLSPWRKVRDDAPTTLPIQMMETMRDSLCPSNPILSKITGIVAIMVIAPISASILIEILLINSDFVFTSVFPLLWPIALLYGVRD